MLSNRDGREFRNQRLYRLTCPSPPPNMFTQWSLRLNPWGRRFPITAS
jgi:hypothetical protein